MGDVDVYLYDVTEMTDNDFCNVGRILAGQRELALDLEWRSDIHRSEQSIDLVQVAVGETVILIRTHQRTLLPVLLRNLLEDPSVVKVMSAVVHPNVDDFRMFLRDFRIDLIESGAVSIGQMAQKRGYTKVGLATLVRHFFNYEYPSWARSNWADRQLSREQLRYAALDAWLTLKVYHKLEKDSRLQNNASRATYDDSHIIGEGAQRYVYAGKYTEGATTGQKCAVKVFKSGSVFEESYFEKDLSVVSKTVEIVDAFNETMSRDCKKIFVCEPQIWTHLQTREHMLVEPFLAEFKKFNSNTGASSGNSYLEALSHFSYQHTNGEYLVCDLQGEEKIDHYALTDPVVLSKNRIFGPTDLGKAGISQFFFYHRCGNFCHRNWIVPARRGANYIRVMNTTFVRN